MRFVHIARTSDQARVEFAARLAFGRATRELPMRVVAERGGLDQGQMSRLERALTDPWMASVVRVAYGLDVSLPWLLGDLALLPIVVWPPGRPRLNREDVARTFGRRAREEREALRATKAAVAGWIGIAPRYVLAYEQAERAPQLSSAVAFAAGLGVSVSSLFEDGREALAWAA